MLELEINQIFTIKISQRLLTISKISKLFVYGHHIINTYKHVIKKRGNISKLGRF